MPCYAYLRSPWGVASVAKTGAMRVPVHETYLRTGHILKYKRNFRVACHQDRPRRKANWDNFSWPPRKQFGELSLGGQIWGTLFFHDPVHTWTEDRSDDDRPLIILEAFASIHG